MEPSFEGAINSQAPTGGNCTNCGGVLAGPICHACGEEQPSHLDLSLKHFLHEALDEVAHFDAKVPATMRALMFDPGRLTVDYFAGRKTRYLRPLRLYLVIFALHFFLFSFFKPVVMFDFDRVLKNQPNDNLEKVLTKLATKKHVELKVLTEQMTHRWQKCISILQISNAFLLACVIAVFFRGYRTFFAEHLVFAMHYCSFAFFLACLNWPVYFVIGLDPSPKFFAWNMVMWMVEAYYLYRALSLFYASPRSGTIWRSVVIMAAGKVSYSIIIAVSVVYTILSVIFW